ncbi:MAG: cupin domain-containing protein [Acidobacteriaceae bacterium]
MWRTCFDVEHFDVHLAWNLGRQSNGVVISSSDRIAQSESTRGRQQRSSAMSDNSSTSSQPASIPPDDLKRQLTVARPDRDQSLPHIGLVGDTYTILLTGKDTAGRFCLIDMHIPPGGGPPPHRHDFEETFAVLEGELEAIFRGATSVVRAGETIHIPANAPHQFHNSSAKPVRLLCICSPAGQENLFYGSGRSRRDSDHGAPQARRGDTSGVQSES